MGLVRAPDGSIVNLPDEQVGGAVASGYEPVSLGQAADSSSAAAAPDTGITGAVGAGASSFLSGATLGLSDLGLKQVLPESGYKQLAADREDHPWVSGAGQFAGLAVPTVLSGGASTPAGYLSSVTARAAEGGLADGVIAAGFEGSLQNAGAYMADAALGDRETTAEGMVGALGTGFAFGSGGALAAHGVIEGTIAARRMFSRAMDAGKQAAEDAVQAWRLQSKEVLDAHEQTAEIAKGKLADAVKARDEAIAARDAAAQAAKAAEDQVSAARRNTVDAGLARDNATAGIADAKLNAPAADLEVAKYDSRGVLIDKLDQQEARAELAAQSVPSEPVPGDLASFARRAAGIDDPAAVQQLAEQAAKSEVALSRPPPTPAELEQLHDLAQKVDEYTAARREFDDVHSRVEVDPDLESSLSGLRAPDSVQSDIAGRGPVPVGEFGEPGKGGIKSPEELQRAVEDAIGDRNDIPLAPSESSQEATNVGRKPRKLAELAAERESLPTPEAVDAAPAPALQQATGAQPPRRAPRSRKPVDVPAGFDPGLISDGAQVFNDDIKIRTGVPNRRQINSKNYKDVGFVVKPSELAEAGVLGIHHPDEATAAAVSRIRDGVREGRDLPPIEVDIDKKGRYFIASGNKRVLALAAEGDRPLLVRFRPISTEHGDLADFSSSIRDAIDGKIKEPAPAPVSKPDKTAVGSLSDLNAILNRAPSYAERKVAEAQAAYPRDAFGHGERTRANIKAKLDLDVVAAPNKAKKANAEYKRALNEGGFHQWRELAEHYASTSPQAKLDLESFDNPALGELADSIVAESEVAPPTPEPAAEVPPTPPPVSTTEPETAKPSTATNVGRRRDKFPTGTPVTRQARSVLSPVLVVAAHAAPAAIASPTSTGGVDDGEPNSMGATAHELASKTGVSVRDAVKSVGVARDLSLVDSTGQITVVGRIVGSAIDGDPAALSMLRASEDTRSRIADGTPTRTRIPAPDAVPYSTEDGLAMLAGAPPRVTEARPEFAGSSESVPPRIARDAFELPNPEPQTELEKLLRGTKEQLDSGRGIRQIGDESPARADYVSDKAAKRARQAQEFRDAAKAPRALAEEAAGPETDLERQLRGTRDGLASGATIGEVRQAGAALHPLDVRRLETAHDDALDRAATAENDLERRRALNDAHAIEQQLSKVGARPGPVEDIAAMARVTTRLEKAAAEMTEALGPEAPQAAQKAAADYRAAEDAANRKVFDRATRAANDHAERPRKSEDEILADVKRRARPEVVTDPVTGKRHLVHPETGEWSPPLPDDYVGKPLSGEERVAAAKEAKDRAAANVSRARGEESKARLEARDARRSLAETRGPVSDRERAVKAATKEWQVSGRARDQAASDIEHRAQLAASENAGRHGGGFIGKAIKVLGVAGELGIPGIPSAHDIPVIGPLLGAYIKYRTLKAATGRFVGRVPATADARAAALAARTKDAIARSVDRSLGIIESNRGAIKVAATASSAVAAAALGRRVFDDGKPDAKKGATTPELAAVRMREVASAVANPQLVSQMVRRQLRDVIDPDLIAAAEAHLMAMFQHLNDTAPKLPPPNPYSMKSPMPSAAAALQWGRRLAVANDPTVALDALQTQTLTPDAADTLRAIYPKLFAAAQRRLIERASDLTNPVPYRQLLQNSLLFGVPLDSSLSPDNAAILSTAHVVNTSGPAPGGPPPGAPAQPPVPSIANPTNLSNLYQPFGSRPGQR